jgi:hypothetical protein
MSTKRKGAKRLRRTLLGMAVVAGSTGAAACRPPMVCDPPPPPSLAPRPTPSRTPMICDPPPPPRTITPGPSATPTPARHFVARSVQVTQDPKVAHAAMRGRVVDASGQPLREVQVAATAKSSGLGSGTIEVITQTDGQGTFYLALTQTGSFMLYLAGDRSNGLPLELKNHDVAVVEWVEVGQAQLPLAEIRAVKILWEEGLSFRATSPWPDARWRWTASAGTLQEDGERVTWQPPAVAGRYLLQVVADWGPAGLAVDALVATVGQDGAIMLA